MHRYVDDRAIQHVIGRDRARAGGFSYVLANYCLFLKKWNLIIQCLHKFEFYGTYRRLFVAQRGVVSAQKFFDPKLDDGTVVDDGVHAVLTAGVCRLDVARAL